MDSYPSGLCFSAYHSRLVAILDIQFLYLTYVLNSFSLKNNLLMNSLPERILIILLRPRSKHLPEPLDKQQRMTHVVSAPFPGMIPLLVTLVVYLFSSCMWRINWVNSDGAMAMFILFGLQFKRCSITYLIGGIIMPRYTYVLIR